MLPNSPPLVPTGLSMPHVWENTFLAMVALPAFIAVVWAARVWRRSGDPFYFVILVGGTVCALLEPLVDLLGLCWYPRGAQLQIFELMGRPIPLFAVIGYTMMFGGFTILAIEILRRRGPRSLWWVWIAAVPFMAIFELFAVYTGSYVYYGTQPLRLFGWPTWWGPVNGLVVITLAVVLTALHPHVRGWRTLLVIPIMPALDAAANAAAAWLVYTTNWSNVSWAVTQVSGLATYAMSAMLVWLLVRVAEQGVPPSTAHSIDRSPHTSSTTITPNLGAIEVS